MKRLAVLLAATLAATIGMLPMTSAAHASAGTFTQYSDQPLPYWVYQPSSYTGTAKVPVVVYLHGCEQSAPDVAVGTRWNSEAEAKGFIAVYPQQLAGLSGPITTGNANACWNFYDPAEVGSRTSGEPAQIAAITREVMTKWNVDPSRVYIIGASGGAAEANVMAVLFPDLYAAVGIVAGCPYGACSDATGTISYGTWLRLGIKPRQVPAFVVDSVTDEVTVYPLNAAAVQQYLGLDDYADDGLDNGSVSRQPASVQNYGFNQTPQPGSGDPCLPTSLTSPPNRFPCPGGVIGFQGTYPYTEMTYNNSSGTQLVKFWTIYGASHGYAGGDPAGSFTDPLGPNITDGAWTFFSAHPMT